MKHLLLFGFIFYSLSLAAQTNPDFDQSGLVDFTDVNAEVSIFPAEERVTGKVKYSFEVLQETDSIYIDAKNMNFNAVTLNGSEVDFHNDNIRLWLISDFDISEENELELRFSATPKQTMYFINWDIPAEVDVTRQVWTQGQGRYTSHWLPSFDDINEKAVFDLTINFLPGFEVTANGELQENRKLNDSVTQWEFSMKDPMSSYLVAMAAGDFTYKEKESTSGVPISLYYLPEDEEKFEPTYRHSREIFDFLEYEIGIPYPWQNYKQIPVQDFLFSGMENTGTTIFADTFVVDSIGFHDKNYVNVNAHELAHQWFGNLVTEKDGNHWLHEGFATYYALLAEKDIFGEDYYYWKLYETAEQLKEMSDSGRGESLLGPGAGSLTYYQKGAWALHILREKTGDEAFKKGIRNYLEKYAYGSVTTDDFLAEIEKTSDMDLSQFKADWLKQSAFQGTEALNSLKESSFIRDYLEIAALRETPFANKIEALDRALDFPVNDYIGQEVVLQLAGERSPEAINLYRKAFETGNLYVRQGIALTMERIPAELKDRFRGLLEDESYLTIETALLKYWMQFPEQTAELLEKTAGIEGFSDKNVRLLWLVISLVSPGVQDERSPEFYDELSGYTQTFYPFEVRQNAFGYLYQINAFSKQNMIDLVKGARHHNYRFRTFCRQLLDRLLERDEYRNEITALFQHFSPGEQEFLKNKLED